MKRYKRDFDIYVHELGRFKESVIHVQHYLDLLKDELNKIERQLKFYKGDSLQLFNDFFQTYKINFYFQDTAKMDISGLIKGITNRENISIYVNELFYDRTNKDNLDVFNYFIDDLLLLIGHELVHRGQYYVRNNDKINFYNFDGSSLHSEIDLEYLKRSSEIMAYAWMYIESLRYMHYTNIEILNMIKTGNYRSSKAINIEFYIKDMKQYNIEAYSKFRKYIVQYLTDPIKYDLKFV